VQGGGNGKDELSVGSEDRSDETSEQRGSWKLEPRLRHLGEGLSSRVSPSWKVEARRLFDVQGDDSGVSKDEWESARLSVLRSPELEEEFYYRKRDKSTLVVLISDSRVLCF
jgi:hypothetical protein